jgi:hypothetical protein
MLKLGYKKIKIYLLPLFFNPSTPKIVAALMERKDLLVILFILSITALFTVCCFSILTVTPKRAATLI